MSNIITVSRAVGMENGTLVINGKLPDIKTDGVEAVLAQCEKDAAALYYFLWHRLPSGTMDRLKDKLNAKH